MGQNPSQVTTKNFTDQEIQSLTNKLLNNTNQKLTITDVQLPISLLLKNLKNKIPVQRKQKGFIINNHFLQIIYHQRFVSTITKLILLLMEKLEEITQKNILFIKRHQWAMLSELVKLILIFTDRKLVETVHVYAVKSSETDQDVKQLIDQLEDYHGTFDIEDKKVLDLLSVNIAESMSSVLMSTLLKLIHQRSNPLNYSSQTQLIVQHVEHSLFMLLNKLTFTPQHYDNFIDKGRNSPILKNFLKIGQYFLGSSCDLSLPSVFQAAVIMILSVVERNQKNLKLIQSDLRGLASFIYPRLPIINKKSVYDFIAMMCLFSLVYVKQGTKCYQRFAFNKMLTFRLLNVLIRQIKVSSGQMTEFIEQLALQTKIGMAERALVTEVVKNYVRLIQEKIVSNRQRQQQRKNTSRLAQTINTITTISQKVINRIKRKPRISTFNDDTLGPTSTFTRESTPSQILNIYLQSGSQPYSIKYQNKRYSIPYIDVVDEIEKDDKELQKQLKPLYEKFVYEFILYKKVIYMHDERYLWSEILPKIIKNRELQGQQLSKSELSQNGDVKNQSRVNVVGYNPVLELRQSSGGQSKRMNSSITSVTKQKQLSSILDLKKHRLQTEQQGIYNQTTQESKVEYMRPESILKEWQKGQSFRKFQPEQQNENKKTPNHKIKRNEQHEEDNAYNGQDSEMQINPQLVDQKDKNLPIEQFVVEDLD